MPVVSHFPLPPWTSMDILFSESVWETDPVSSKQHWCKMAGERNRRCFWWTLRALGWTGSCFLKCLLSLSRVWPKGCSDIHLWHLCMVQWASSTPLGSDRVWAMLFCGFPPSWSPTEPCRSLLMPLFMIWTTQRNQCQICTEMSYGKRCMI